MCLAAGTAFMPAMSCLSLVTNPGAEAGLLAETKNSPGILSVVPKSISAGDACRSSLNAVRKPSSTAGSASGHGTCGLHMSAAFSVR